MSEKRIYFDNAASSFPKPDAVIDAMSAFLKTCGNPGRGDHSFALEGARKIFDAREIIAKFFGVKLSERLIFTSGCTASINMVLRGMALGGRLGAGDVVIVSSLEHNAVMRPLAQLRELMGISYVVCEAGEGFETRLNALVQEHKPKLVALTWASNVTGEVLPIESVARTLKAKNIPFLVDGAQVAGKLDVKLDDSGITFFCASGHKGLLGAPGVGLLYVAPDASLVPSILGGTGSRSESFEVPEEYPDHLEAGTLPGPAIAALAAGVHWLESEGVSTALKRELALTQRFLAWANGKDYIKVFGPPGTENRMPVVSFSMIDVHSSTLAERLDTEYGIAVRRGLHCASLCHEHLGTLKEGLVRASFGVFNIEAEVDTLTHALERIASS